MYLISQLWTLLVVAATLGAALGLAVGLARARAREGARVADVRTDAMADLVKLKAELASSQEWHARELTEQRLAHEAALRELALAQMRDQAQAEGEVALREQVEALKADLQRLQQDREEVSQQRLRLAERLASTEAALESEQARAVQLEAGLAQARKDLEQAGDLRRADAAAWMSRLRASSETAASNESQTQARLEQARAALGDLQARLDEALARENALNDQLRRFRQTSEVVRRVQIENWQERREADARRLEAVEEQGDLASRLSSAQARCDELVARVQQHEAEREDLEEQLAAARSTLAHAAQAGDAREGRLSTELVDLRAEVERLRRERTEASRSAVRQHRPSRLALLDAAEVRGLIEAAGNGQPPVPVTPGHVPVDDLSVLDGIAPDQVDWLHGLGIHHHWQIAAWSADEAAWVCRHLPGDGAVVWRGHWVAQCARLMAREGLHVSV